MIIINEIELIIIVIIFMLIASFLTAIILILYDTKKIETGQEIDIEKYFVDLDVNKLIEQTDTKISGYKPTALNEKGLLDYE